MSKAKHFLRWLFFGLVTLIFVAGLGSGVGYYEIRKYSKDLPSLDPILKYHPFLSTRVYADDGTLIGEFYYEKRILKPLSEIPRTMQLAIIAAEDKNFYRHHGIDYEAVVRASVANWRAGHVVQGGSTITQQVVKMLLVGNERSFGRKIREALLARRLEQALTKNQILEVYLNQVYLGHGAYGVAAAAEVYFEKSLGKLTIGEITMIAGLTKSPAMDSPYHNLRRACLRQEYVVVRMMEAGYITATEAHQAISFIPNVAQGPININLRHAPHFVEFLRRELKEEYGDELVYGGGLSVYTTLDLKVQQAAEREVKKAVKELNQTFPWTGPIGDTNLKELNLCHPLVGLPLKSRKRLSIIPPGFRGIGIVVSLAPQVTVCTKHQLFTFSEKESDLIRQWIGKDSQKKRQVMCGDLLPVEFLLDANNLLQTPKRLTVHLAKVAPVEAAALVIDRFGNIRAMVGGSDFSASEWNRVTQAKRQAGSAIKPYIYSKAIEDGYTEMSKVADAPIAVKTVAGLWQPKNYKKEYLGPITLRTAFSKSINTVSVRLVQDIGLDPTIEMMKRFGLKGQIPRHISIALGTSDVTLFDMSYAYNVFPNDGLKESPTYITKILQPTSNGEKIYGLMPHESKLVLTPDVSYVMVDLMKAVVQTGTGRKAKDFGLSEEQIKKHIGKPRPVAGKTGTSTDFRDAWFIGYTKDLLCGIWVGRDDFTPIGYDATGGKIALPIWLGIMNDAQPATPFQDFEVPHDISFKYMEPKTGRELSPNTPGGVMIPFREQDFDHVQVDDENLK